MSEPDEWCEAYESDSMLGGITSGDCSKSRKRLVDALARSQAEVKALREAGAALLHTTYLNQDLCRDEIEAARDEWARALASTGDTHE